MLEAPLYHSRITKGYEEYLRKHHPEVDLTPLFDYAGITPYQLDDKGSWLTQTQVDRFHEILVRTTGIADISRKTGRYMPYAKVASTLRQYVLGFMTPAMTYQVMGKIYPHMSRGATVETRRIGDNRIEAVVVKTPGVSEQPFQCEYRLGLFESLALLFTDKMAQVEHPTCMHISGDRCIYQIRWEQAPSVRWKRMVRFGSLLAAVSGLTLLALFPGPHSLAAVLSMLLIVTGAFCYQIELEKRELTLVVNKQGDLAKDLLAETNARYNNAVFVQEIGQALANILDSDALLNVALETIEKRLNFDRGLILLANREGTQLTCRAGFGYAQEEPDALRDRIFHPDRDAKDPFAVCFRQLKPILSNDRHEIEKMIAAGPIGPAEAGADGSFLCVPIVYEGKAEGILAVDNHRSGGQIDQSLVNLLAGVANQIGISIHNAEAYRLIQESENRFRALIQNASDVVSVLDERSCFIYNTPSAEKVFGYAPEELAGKAPFAFIHPEDLPRVRATFREVVRGKNVGVPAEFRFLKKDGSWAFVESLGSNLFQYRGIDGMVITSRDITDRKRSEQERRVLEEKLQRSAKMEALGTLAGGVAHDLNNVLGVLVGYSELLMMEIPPDDPRREYIDNIMKSGERGSAIVQDLLALARRGVAVSEIANLNTLISEYLDTPDFKKLAASHPHIEFRAELDPALLNIKGSPVHLSKTMMNLVINAMEAITDAGVVVIRTANRYLDTPLQGYEIAREGDYAVLTVADDGRGIRAADMEKIFEPFFTKKIMGHSGTGLGLAVVWGTVKDHDGYINVQSEEGKGTQFTLFFPVTRESTAEESATTPRETYAGGGETILVVDDVQEQRELARRILTGLGYRVSTAAGGEEAIAYLKENSADLLVLDMIMEPGMDGLSTYQRALEIHPQQRAIVVSGFSETERVRRAQELGAGTYVRKPYIIEQIGLAVRRELDRR